MTLHCLAFNGMRMFVHSLLRLFSIFLSALCLKGNPIIVFFLMAVNGWIDLGCMESNYNEIVNVYEHTNPDNVLIIIDIPSCHCPPLLVSLFCEQIFPRKNLYAVNIFGGNVANTSLISKQKEGSCRLS